MVCLMIKTTEKQDEKRREGEKQMSSRGWFRTTQLGESETERERLAGEVTY